MTAGGPGDPQAPINRNGMVRMRYQAVLFDMDGTFIPQDLHEFMSGIVREQCLSMHEFGISPEQLEKATMASAYAMLRNDGSETNEEAFWRQFSAILGISREKLEPSVLDFYEHGFERTRRYTGENPLAPAAVAAAHRVAPHVAVATNPVFPLSTQRIRMSWVGLKESDFDLVTSYEQDRFCKPNPAYYLSVCERLGVEPEACLMIGNDEHEDMYACSLVGMDRYLVTDCRIRDPEHPYSGKQGTFADMTAYLSELASKDG